MNRPLRRSCCLRRLDALAARAASAKIKDTRRPANRPASAGARRQRREPDFLADLFSKRRDPGRSAPRPALGFDRYRSMRMSPPVAPTTSSAICMVPSQPWRGSTEGYDICAARVCSQSAEQHRSLLRCFIALVLANCGLDDIPISPSSFVDEDHALVR